MRVFENRVMRSIYELKRDGVTRNWRTVHNEELNDLYSAPNIILVLNPRILRWTGHVSRMVVRRGAYRVLVEKPEGKRQLEDLDVDGSIILSWIFMKFYIFVLTGLTWLRIRTDGGLL